MTGIYRKHPGFDRPSELTGTDIALQNQDDFLLSGYGDFTTLTGADLITQALLRRLQTPASGYRRLVRSADGLQAIDTEYGNLAYDYLSSSATPANLMQIEKALRDCVSAESRVELLDVNVTQDPLSPQNVNAEVKYRILSETELRVLQVRVA